MPDEMAPPTLAYETQAAAIPADPIPLRRRLAAEFVGTFALVFVGCGAIATDGLLPGDGVGLLGVSVAFGLVVAAFIYAVGDVSGAHFNPAVSFAFALAGRMRPRDAVAFGCTQCVGATLASASHWAAFWKLDALGATVPGTIYAYNHLGGREFGDDNGVVYGLYPTWGATAEQAVGVARALGAECILTFFLVFVILCVAVGSKERGLMAGIAIGGTVAFCALVGGPVSGASMNPARSLGPALFSGWEALRHLWIYWTAPFLGAAIAVVAWGFIYRHPRLAVEAHLVTRPSN